MARHADVQYLVLPDATNPYLLARVRWPDVFHAISPARPDWQEDPGLFDLPYDASSTPVTPDHAAAIAAEWGARLPADEDAGSSEASLIRRMPADWSNLSPAEKRAWSIDVLKSAKRRARVEQPSGARRWWRRRGDAPALARAGHTATPEGGTGVIDLTAAGDLDIIDLTGTDDSALTTAEDE